jgi:hypothetical protein
LIVREAKEEEIYNVLFDESIWPNISDDSVDKDSWRLPDNCVCFTTCGTDIFILHGDGVIHANVLPGTSDKVGRGKAFLSHIFNITDLDELYAQIPNCFKNVYDYAVACGFKEFDFNDTHKFMRIERWV